MGKVFHYFSILVEVINYALVVCDEKLQSFNCKPLGLINKLSNMVEKDKGECNTKYNTTFVITVQY